MIIRIVVDLPDPFGPRKPVTVPGVTSKVSELTAAIRPYRFVRDLTAIIGSPCGTRLHAIGRSRYEHRGRRGIRLPAAFRRGIALPTATPGRSSAGRRTGRGPTRLRGCGGSPRPVRAPAR